MQDKTKPINGATYLDDISGLKLPNKKAYKQNEIYEKEAINIAKATIKYLSSAPTKEQAPFSFDWVIDLHKEMLGDVWDWAGKLRQIELSIGIKAYLVPMELKNLCDDILYWDENKTYDIFETATRIHHRAVQIHPFKNGNGRWSRMLANIYLRESGQSVKRQEDLLSRKKHNRYTYIDIIE